MCECVCVTYKEKVRDRETISYLTTQISYQTKAYGVVRYLET